MTTTVITQEQLDEQFKAITEQTKRKLAPIHKEMKRINAQRELIDQQIIALRKRKKELGAEFSTWCDKAADIKLDDRNQRNALQKAFNLNREKQHKAAMQQSIEQRIGENVSDFLKKLFADGKCPAVKGVGFEIRVKPDGSLETRITAEQQNKEE